jgi:hypothetical protein
VMKVVQLHVKREREVQARLTQQLAGIVSIAQTMCRQGQGAG